MRQKPLFKPKWGWDARYAAPGGRKISDCHYSSDRVSGLNYAGPMMFCVTCGRCANNKICCGHETISIGFCGRAPRTSASRKQWKRFCEHFKIPFSKLKFV